LRKRKEENEEIIKRRIDRKRERAWGREDKREE